MDTLAQKVWRNPWYFMACGFGSGLLPYMPGTWGTLAALPLYFCLSYLPWIAYVFITCGALVLGVYACDIVSREQGVHDDARIVWDEIVGYFLTMFLAPHGFVWMVLGFVLFRIFDIWKPAPIRWVDQHVQGGLGIMLDDVAAALPAWIILQVCAWRFAV